MRRDLTVQSVPSQRSPEIRAGISNRAAAAAVKKRYNKSRILGVTQFDQRGAPMYRVRTLSPNGIVKSVVVDGNSGEVLE